MVDHQEIVVQSKHVRIPRTTTGEICRDQAHLTIDVLIYRDHHPSLNLKAILGHLPIKVRLNQAISSNLYRDLRVPLTVHDFVRRARTAHRETDHHPTCSDRRIKIGLRWVVLPTRTVQEMTINSLGKVLACNDVVRRSMFDRLTT
jgi:hypothetical protein